MQEVLRVARSSAILRHKGNKSKPAEVDPIVKISQQQGPMEPGTYGQALLNFKAAILLDHPVNKLSLQDSVIWYWHSVSWNPSRGTLTSLMLHIGHRHNLCNVNADQRSVDWITGALNLPTPLKMTLRIWDKESTHPEQLLQCIKGFNPGLNMEAWRFWIQRTRLLADDLSFL